MGPKIKTGICWSPQTPLADKCLHVAIVPANTNQRTKLQLSSSISFRDKEGVPKFNVGATSPLPYLYAETFMYARSTLQGQTVCQISASYRYASCSYANMYYHYICPKMGFLSVLRVKMWKYCFLSPKGTTLREYASVDVSHITIGSTAWAQSPWEKIAYKEEF